VRRLKAQTTYGPRSGVSHRHCDNIACTTILSMYNPGPYCACCAAKNEIQLALEEQQERVRRMPLRARLVPRDGDVLVYRAQRCRSTTEPVADVLSHMEWPVNA
jgi:hypothetical protein